MAEREPLQTSTWPLELEALLVRLRDETIWLAFLGLCLAGVIMTGALRFRDPASGALTGLSFAVLAIVVWVFRRQNYLVAAWSLVTGTLVIILLVVARGGVEQVIWLLMFPAGLAILTISRKAGVATAAGSTLALLLLPASWLPVEFSQRMLALIGVWSTLGMIWLALRPLLTSVQWAWTGYERSQTLLEQARDTQVQLKQALQDLEDANVQLTRLNQLAQGMRQAAENERRAKEQFVANVSHELRTPLNMIVGFCEMLTQSPQTYGADIPPALLADLDVVLRNGQHLSSLIDDVLDLSQIDAGRMALNKERVSVAEIIQAAVIAVRPLFSSKNLRLEIEAPDDLPLLLCDRTRIREVVLNLLSNAGRFTEQGGVQVRAWQDAHHVVISVADTGPGIAEKDQAKLFQPFQQLDGTIRRRYAGTGLGLSISKSFVELHGGKLWVESKKNQGTTFFFRLPIDEPAALSGGAVRWTNPYQPYEQRIRPSRYRPPEARPRLVIAERGNVMQRLVGRYLSGVEIVPTADVDAALQALAGVPSRALLVNDIHVADMLDRLNQPSALPYGTPAIVSFLPGLAQATDALGVFDYLVKPISREALLSSLDRLQPAVKTVLVVDDEPDALRLFRRMLSSAERDYRVLRASDGKQALSILREQRPDVILLDLMMPELDGFQLLAIKEQDPNLRDIPVILISALDPLGQPIASNMLAVVRGGGLSAHQVLTCIETLIEVLSPGGSTGDRATIATSPD